MPKRKVQDYWTFKHPSNGMYSILFHNKNSYDEFLSYCDNTSHVLYSKIHTEPHLWLLATNLTSIISITDAVENARLFALAIRDLQKET